MRKKAILAIHALLVFQASAIIYVSASEAQPYTVYGSNGTVNVHYNSGNRRIAREGDVVVTLVPVAASADHTYRSTDDGLTWSQIDTDGLYSGVLVRGASNYVYHFWASSTDLYMSKFLYDGTPSAPASILSGLDAEVAAYRSVSASVDSSGRLFVVYGNGDPDGIYCITSTDGGSNWNGPYTIQAPSTYTFYVARIEIDQDDNALVVYQGGYGQATQPFYFAKSTDHGATWSAPVTVSASNRSNPDILPASATTYYIFCQSGADPYGCRVVKSTDGGANWGSFVTIEETITTQGYADPSGALGDDGSIYVSYRNDSVAGSAQWREHIARSDDAGETWTVIYAYDEATYRSGTRSHLRYQTWFSGGGSLDAVWMQYDDDNTSPTNKPVLFYTDNTVEIEQAESPVPASLTGCVITGGSMQ